MTKVPILYTHYALRPSTSLSPPPDTHTHTQTHQNKYFGTATLFLQASAGINIVLSARVHSGQTKTSGFWCAPTNEERKECKAFYVCFLLT